MILRTKIKRIKTAVNRNGIKRDKKNINITSIINLEYLIENLVYRFFNTLPFCC